MSNIKTLSPPQIYTKFKTLSLSALASRSHLLDLSLQRGIITGIIYIICRNILRLDTVLVQDFVLQGRRLQLVFQYLVRLLYMDFTWQLSILLNWMQMVQRCFLLFSLRFREVVAPLHTLIYFPDVLLTDIWVQDKGAVIVLWFVVPLVQLAYLLVDRVPSVILGRQLQHVQVVGYFVSHLEDFGVSSTNSAFDAKLKRNT